MEQTKHRAGAKIRAFRRARCLSVEGLGMLLQPDDPVPYMTIYNWETRGKIARPAHQRRLAELEVCVADDWLQPADAIAPPPGCGAGAALIPAPGP